MKSGSQTGYGYDTYNCQTLSNRGTRLASVSTFLNNQIPPGDIGGEDTTVLYSCTVRLKTHDGQYEHKPYLFAYGYRDKRENGLNWNRGSV